MGKEIIAAKVSAKSQNRLALGIFHAYVAMHPDTTADTLSELFPKSEVCPDAGLPKLFYTAQEIVQKVAVEKDKWFVAGSACFVDQGEWIAVDSGQEIALGKMWTADSLAKLQTAMAKYGITGEVDKTCKEDCGFSIAYEYAEQAMKIKKVANHGDYLICLEESGAITVWEKQANASAHCREIAEKVGLEYEQSWGPRTLGTKLLNLLS